MTRTLYTLTLLTLTLLVAPTLAMADTASGEESAHVDAPIAMAVLTRGTVSPRMTRALEEELARNPRVESRAAAPLRSALGAAKIDANALPEVDTKALSTVMRKQGVEAILVLDRSEDGGEYRVLTIGPDGTRAGELARPLQLTSSTFEQDLSKFLQAAVLLTRPQVIIYRKNRHAALNAPIEPAVKAPPKPPVEEQPVDARPPEEPALKPSGATTPAPSVEAEAPKKSSSLLEHRPYPPRLSYMTFSITFDGLMTPQSTRKEDYSLDVIPFGGGIGGRGRVAQWERAELRWDANIRASYALAAIADRDGRLPEIDEILTRRLDAAFSAFSKRNTWVSVGGKIGAERYNQTYSGGFGDLKITSARLGPVMRLQGKRISLEAEAAGRLGGVKQEVDAALIFGADVRANIQVLVGRFGILTLGSRRSFERANGLAPSALLPTEGRLIHRDSTVHVGVGFAL